MPQDTDSRQRPSRIQARPFWALPGVYVFVGGALGATVRAFFDWLNAGRGLFHIAFSTMLVNVLGAYLMGLLMAKWLRERGEHPSWDRFKLFAGTGFLGALTTYSSFAIMVARGEEHSALTWVVAIVLVIAGMLAVIGGFATGERWGKRHGSEEVAPQGGK